MATVDFAPRLRLPSWRDPRLVVGILLVLGSLLLGTWAVGSRDTTVGVWAATTTLAPGDDVTAATVRIARVHLDTALTGYLPATRALPRHLVALRPVGPGELLPRGAVGSAASLRERPVGVTVTGPLASGIVKGAAVDVWVSLPASSTASAASAVTLGSRAFAAPTLLAAGARVSEVSAQRTGLAADGSSTVQILLDTKTLPTLLADQTAGARTSLVLVPGSRPAKS